MFILLLLFATLASADDMSSEKYCFPSAAQSAVAKQKFSMIQVPSDTATTDGNCLVIQMRPHRRELIQKYILSSVLGASVSFSSAEIQREICKLKVEKEKMKESEKTNIDVNQNLEVAASNTQGTINETMQIETMGEFEFSVDQDQIKGTCLSRNSNRYEIVLEVRKNPRPIISPFITQPPPDQEISVLKTQLLLSRGERIEVGNILKELKNKDNKVDINPTLNIETASQNTLEKVFLSIN
jgi:hypothetical protein